MATQTIQDIYSASTQMSSALGSEKQALQAFARDRIKIKQDTLKTLSGLEAAHSRESVSQLQGANKQISALNQTVSKSLSGGLSKSLYDIVSGSKSAKDSFKDFAKSFTQDILQMSTRMIAMQAIKSSLGALGFSGASMSAYSSGGIMPGHFISATPMATGGVFSRPTLGLVAEGKNSEAVVPLPDNRSIPVKMTGNQAQQPITVVNVLDQGMIESVVTDTLAKKSQVIVNMVGNDMRQGGVTYQAVKGMR